MGLLIDMPLEAGGQLRNRGQFSEREEIGEKERGCLYKPILKGQSYPPVSKITSTNVRMTMALNSGSIL